ncbi:MAG TPA: glutathione S-transferase [Paracoccaceae bacterium]|nr:glutathione S-transferase [Paracoccaceae bacterium]
MRLYHSPTSPFVRKVMVLLHETDQAEGVELVPATGTPLDPATMPVAQNPLGKVPCLERPDGPAIHDSRVITRYLDERVGGRLYPRPPKLWECLTLEATADGMMEAAVLMRYEETLRPEPLRMPAFVEGQWQKIARSLDAAEGRWIAYLKGPFCMGQVALGCALGYLDLRHAARHWRASRAELAHWYDAISTRPSFVATRPPAA